MSENWIYSGLLDDSHLRYDPLARSQGSEFFYDQLLKQVFFGYPILLNDGYVFSDAGLDQLIDSSSLLRNLLSIGFIKIITRSAELDPDSFSEIPENQAIRGQETAKRLVSRSDYKEIKKKINSFANIANNGRIERFPNRKMHEGFHKLIRRISDKTVEDIGIFGMTTEMWRQFINTASISEKYYEFPRDTIEKHALNLYKNKTVSWPTVQSIMAVANQAYHYNFSLCLSSEKGFPVAADTTIGFAFEDLLEFDQMYEVDPHDWRNAPRITIPKKFPKNDFDLIRGFVTPGTDIYQEKMQFLKYSSSAISSGKGDVRDELDRVFNTYRRQIASEFSKRGYRTPLRILADAATGSAVGMGVSELNGAIGIVHDLAPVAGAIVGGWGKYPDIEKVPGLSSTTSYIKHIAKETNRSLVEMAIRSRPGVGTDERRYIPAYSGVAFNNNAATSHTSDIPRFS